ncbi:hypothetical protein R5W23_004272 [Gemmata sp. JC673]|uniref:DUF6797 domain-containing protein n=1 Tax=Gemmata algarum TaxID=2975278 RepID=A0ABU5F6N7_9BACT|nr:DUF6797 domain-containing protein [Gemmata algarum]MDY3562793.1 hypothetical protein [Gemmata algarum]
MPLVLLLVAVSAAPDRPAAPPPRPAVPPGIDPALADWTPRPAVGKAEPWERMTDKDWIDPRFRDMNTGPFLNCTMQYPLGKGRETIYKATVVRVGAKDEFAAVFDRSTMRVSAAWAGGYLNHSDRRFGLLNTPTPKGEMLSADPAGPGWAAPNGTWDAPKPFTAPLPREWVKYRGLYVHGSRVIFSYTVNGREVFQTLEPGETNEGTPTLVRVTEVRPGKAVVTRGTPGPNGSHVVTPADITSVTRESLRGSLKSADTTAESAPSRLTKGGPKRWGDPIVTQLVRGKPAGAFALDTLTIPYKNRFGALFFCTGVDFLKDGRIAMCTCHGDVWLVTVEEKEGTCSWQRHATGLYHPLGLKVVDGKVVVLERGQLTRLHDLNSDGEADFYECVSNDWHTGAGEHSYDTCLETDPEGNFYFFKTGDTHLPSGGTLIRVTKDGAKAEVFCTGFRHPIGMGMSPTGVLTGADQEGNWMPATRIDQYRKGGFYGDMRGHHRTTPPTTYDNPLCWLPREVDNSAGGQVWVPKGAFGPLAGLPLHLSYGRCRPYVLLRQELSDGSAQGGVAGLGIQFLSGVCRGRFGPDGNLYVCGLNGWQTAARADGCLQRVRYTGQPLDVATGLEVRGNVLKLTFARPLDPKSIAVIDNYRCAWWNYRWSGEYGSKRWRPSDPNAEGQDDVPVQSATLSTDGRTLELTFTALKPVMQMQVGYNVKAADGAAVTGSVVLTINSTN